MSRNGELRIIGTKLVLHEDECDRDHFFSPGMLQVFGSALARLKARGFSVEKDPGVEKNYKSLSRGHRVGTRNGLHYYARLSGRCIEIEFFVDGERGQYDFDKYNRMPRRVQIACIALLASLVETLLTYGYRLGRDLKPDVLSIRDAVENRRLDALAEFNRSWTSERFVRDETGWPSAKETRWQAKTDADGKTLANGDRRFARIRGRLFSGRAYGGINGNWALVSDGGPWVYVQASDLFSCEDPSALPRRLMKDARERVAKLLDRALKEKRWRDVSRLALVMERAA